MMIPNENIEAYVHDLARQHGISYEKTELDKWADAITALSGDEVLLDETEELIIALARAGLIDKDAVVPLQVYYLQEKAAGVIPHYPNLDNYPGLG